MLEFISIHSAIASGDVRLVLARPHQRLFQSTPLSLAETTNVIAEQERLNISIHSAIASGDARDGLIDEQIAEFQSTPLSLAETDKMGFRRSGW